MLATTGNRSLLTENSRLNSLLYPSSASRALSAACFSGRTFDSDTAADTESSFSLNDIVSAFKSSGDVAMRKRGEERTRGSKLSAAQRFIALPYEGYLVDKPSQPSRRAEWWEACPRTGRPYTIRRFAEC